MNIDMSLILRGTGMFLAAASAAWVVYILLGSIRTESKAAKQLREFRGDVQQNSLLDVDNAKFNKLRDYKASVGVEFRIQVPIVNVPFRLIYYYNPNANLGFTEQLPGIFLPGKRNGFRFTVGRTF